MLAGLLIAGGIWAGSASAAPTVSGGNPPTVGATVTASPDLGSTVDGWVSCTASGQPLAPVGSGASYVLEAGDVNGYVCAQESPYVGTGATYSGPVGPVEPAREPAVSDAGAAVQQGQTLTLTQGAWGSGAAVSDTWEDCAANGTGCVPVASHATGTSYTVARSDAGHALAVLETASANGRGASKLTAPTGLAVASTPVNTSPPTVSGTPGVGHTLSASPGAWTNDPTGYGFAWARCTQGGCTRIPGADQQTYDPDATDVGDSLEVLVTASVPGNASDAYPSYPTAEVAGVGGTPASGSGAGSGSGGSSGGRHGAPLAKVTTTMEWSFRYAPDFTEILALNVDAPAFGSTITTTCHGRGCPFRTRRATVRKPKRCGHSTRRGCRPPKTFDIQRRFHRRHLRVGARVTVTISRPHAVGKYYGFTVRHRRAPAVRIQCLVPGSTHPGRGCRL